MDGIKKGKSGLSSCRRDLFDCKEAKREERMRDESDFDASNILESDQKSMPFSRISEGEFEESPPQPSLNQRLATVSSQSNGVFKLKPMPTESSGHMRSLNFDANHVSADVRMNTKSSKSSTLRKSAKRDFDSTSSRMRSNPHQGVSSSTFEQQDST